MNWTSGTGVASRLSAASASEPDSEHPHSDDKPYADPDEEPACVAVARPQEGLVVARGDAVYAVLNLGLASSHVYHMSSGTPDAAAMRRVNWTLAGALWGLALLALGLSWASS